MTESAGEFMRLVLPGELAANPWFDRGLDWTKGYGQNKAMHRDQVIGALRTHEQELRAAGVVSVSVFGAVARGEHPTHDVDVVVRLGKKFSEPGLDYISRLDALEHRLSEILGCRVDVVEEPVRRERFQREIDRDRALAF
jgi:predicted nucleotidyltransferase